MDRAYVYMYIYLLNGHGYFLVYCIYIIAYCQYALIAKLSRASDLHIITTLHFIVVTSFLSTCINNYSIKIFFILKQCYVYILFVLFTFFVEGGCIVDPCKNGTCEIDHRVSVCICWSGESTC